MAYFKNELIRKRQKTNRLMDMGRSKAAGAAHSVMNKKGYFRKTKLTSIVFAVCGIFVGALIMVIIYLGAACYSPEGEEYSDDTTFSNARLLADKATELAYPDLPDDAKYKGGRPTPEYAAALERTYPNRSSWSAAPRAGASCDVFVGVCIYVSGKLKHASLAHWYPRTTKPGKRIKIQGKKLIRVYRVKG